MKAMVRTAIVIVAIVGGVCGGAQSRAEDAYGDLPDGGKDIIAATEHYLLPAHPLAGPGSEDALVLTVEQCVSRALAHHPRVAAAREAVIAKRGAAGRARASLKPRATAQTAFRRADEQYDDFGLGPFGLSNVLTDLQGDRDSRTDRFSVSQVLYAGGRLRAAAEASDYLAQAEEWRKEAAAHAVAFEAKEAYYDCLLARALVRVADASVVTFRRHLNDAEQKFKARVVARFEVLRAKTELGARQADAVAARNLERIALVNLRRVLALAQDTSIRFAGELNWRPLDRTVPERVAEAVERRPETRALRKGILAAEQDLRRVKGSYLPQIAGSAEWSETDGGAGIATEGWSFTVGDEWELYAGGRRKYERVEANAQVQNLKHQLADIEQLVELEVRRAVIQVEDALARVASEKGTLALAQEGLRIAELRFREGVGTQAEILDAELALTRAESMLAQALRDYAVAHAALDKSTGGAVVGDSASSP